MNKSKEIILLVALHSDMVIEENEIRNNLIDVHDLSNLIIDPLREESSQTNVILQYKLLAAILSAFCSVIQQS